MHVIIILLISFQLINMGMQNVNSKIYPNNYVYEYYMTIMLCVIIKCVCASRTSTLALYPTTLLRYF